MSAQVPVVRTPSSGVPTEKEPTVVVSSESSSNGTYSNPQEAANAPKLLGVNDVVQWHSLYCSIMRRPSLFLVCSFNLDLGYSVLHLENELEGKVIPKQKNKSKYY